MTESFLKVQSLIQTSTTTSVELTIDTYPQKLLATSQSLINDGHYSISVVVAHMACEFRVERALSTAFAYKGLEYLEASVIGFLNGYNLGGNNKICKLYMALTNDPVNRQPFWQEFKDSTKRRNGIVHGGKVVDQIEADKSYQAASALIAHLDQQCSRLG